MKRQGVSGVAREEEPVDDFRKRFLSKLDKKKQQQSQLPTEDEEPLPEPVQPIHADPQARRNAPCPCGSGKKYKKCCGQGS